MKNPKPNKYTHPVISQKAKVSYTNENYIRGNVLPTKKYQVEKYVTNHN